MSMKFREVRFTGSHGYIMRKYTDDNVVKFELSDRKEPAYLFKTNYQCYLVAALLGIINKRTADANSIKYDDPEIDKGAHILVDTIMSNNSDFQKVHEFMVFNEDDGLSMDAKVKKAFSTLSAEESSTEQDKLEEYVRGGLEIIDETFSNCHNTYDFSKTLVDFIDKYNIYGTN